MLPVSVDLVAVTMAAGELAVHVTKRAESPQKGRWELPWATVEAAEKLSARANALATGLGLPTQGLRQLGAYDGVRRDPRGATVSIAWWLPVSADLAEAIGGFRPVGDLLAGRIAFEQGRLLSDLQERLADELVTTTVAARLVAERFTMADLRRVYEAAWGVNLDAANFHRKVTKSHDLAVATDELSHGGPGRPAVLYRSSEVEYLSSPMARPAV